MSMSLYIQVMKWYRWVSKLRGVLTLSQLCVSNVTNTSRVGEIHLHSVRVPEHI